MRRSPKVRVGAVSYLNTRPLVYGFAGQAPHAQLTFDLPSRLADQLAAGDLDVALIPAVEAFQNPEYTIVSDACIGCRGPVLSVKLFVRSPVEQIKTLALDEGSRTSAALVRILLKQRFNCEPQLELLPIGSGIEDTQADAVLLIGDRAIHPPPGDFTLVWDLGDVWCRWSELSFVFAMWTARPGVDLQGVDAALSACRDAGVANLEEIAAEHAADVNLSHDDCLRYLRDNLYFYLGSRERRGLQLFQKHAAELNLAPPSPLRFSYDCQTSG